MVYSRIVPYKIGIGLVRVKNKPIVAKRWDFWEWVKADKLDFDMIKQPVPNCENDKCSVQELGLVLLIGQ